MLEIPRLIREDTCAKSGAKHVIWFNPLFTVGDDTPRRDPGKKSMKRLMPN